MSCKVAAFPFQINPNYGTWSIDFGFNVGLVDAKTSISRKFIVNLLPFSILKRLEQNKKKMSIVLKIRGLYNGYDPKKISYKFSATSVE